MVSTQKSKKYSTIVPKDEQFAEVIYKIECYTAKKYPSICRNFSLKFYGIVYFFYENSTISAIAIIRL